MKLRQKLSPYRKHLQGKANPWGTEIAYSWVNRKGLVEEISPDFNRTTISGVYPEKYAAPGDLHQDRKQNKFLKYRGETGEIK